MRAKRYGHDPDAYLKDVFERLPGMKTGELDVLLPANWQQANQAAAPAQMAG